MGRESITGIASLRIGICTRALIFSFDLPTATTTYASPMILANTLITLLSSVRSLIISA